MVDNSVRGGMPDLDMLGSSSQNACGGDGAASDQVCGQGARDGAASSPGGKKADSQKAGAQSSPGKRLCGLLPFLIKRDGTWLYRGSPIKRKEMICLFSSVLRRDKEGYKLRTPAEEGAIEVEDAPFVAVELDWTGEGRAQKLTFRTNVDQLITAGPDHPIRVAHDILTCEPIPYLHVRDGEDGAPPIEARISRAVYYELVALAEPRDVCCRRLLGVWSCGTFFSLGELPAGQDSGQGCG